MISNQYRSNGVFYQTGSSIIPSRVGGVVVRSGLRDSTAIAEVVKEE